MPIKKNKMERISFVIVLLLFLKTAEAQTVNRVGGSYEPLMDKPLIDSSVYEKWPLVAGCGITNNGEYLYCAETNMVKDTYVTVLKSAKGSWEMKIPNMIGTAFTADSKLALYLSTDTLYIIKLGKSYLRKMPMVKAFQVSNHKDGEWIAFMLEPKNEVVLENLISGERRLYSSVKDFSFSEEGRVLVLEKELEEDGGQSIELVNILTGEDIAIWKGHGLENKILDSTGSEVVFMVSDKNTNEKSIWYYRKGEKESRLLVSNRSTEIDGSFVVDALTDFNSNGGYLFFNMLKKEVPKVLDSKARKTTVNVWSYLDEKLQSAQLIDSGIRVSYPFVVDLESRHVTQLAEDNESIIAWSDDENTYIVQKSPESEDVVGPGKVTYYLRSIKNGRNILLDIKGRHIINLSPDGRYVLYYNSELNSYISYDVLTNVYHNITSGTSTSWTCIYQEDLSKEPRGVVGWIDRDKAALIYDKYDIWMIDPSGRKKPLSVTNGYGIKHKIVFYTGLARTSTFYSGDTLVLNALNLETKQNGFFQKVIGASGDPELLTMNDCIYQLVDNPYIEENGTYPVKAKDEKKYILSRMKYNESPNYYYTEDFRDFVQESNLHPERKYNWYKTELHSWKREDGHQMQGILYKPENFDPGKKYPVIIHYYEKKSFALNMYIFPENINGGCNINIPTYVSNGYLVFTPDIDYVLGDPMQGTYDAVISTADHLSTLSFIDKERIGIGGCSFGGLQTNYLVTHTNLFRAAYSSSSMSDMISAYGDVPGRYKSLSGYFELGGQARMGGTLWQRPEKYIKNSAIFNADKVSTPLLLMHTTNDGVYSFSQALEFFVALRRLGKKVWLLEYTDANHGVSGGAAIDFGIRLRQFFDHYLMGKPAPVWMTRGVPAKMKGIESGYEFDDSIKTPGMGLILQSEEEKGKK